MILRKKIEDIISQGGEVQADKDSKKDFIVFSLRVRVDIYEMIEEELKKERIGLSRNAWIMEAIQEKLKKS